jgi:hypothetical protein
MGQELLVAIEKAFAERRFCRITYNSIEAGYFFWAACSSLRDPTRMPVMP